MSPMNRRTFLRFGLAASAACCAGSYPVFIEVLRLASSGLSSLQ
ncbi:MAG: hypothetical protein GF401_06985 [Chitinivibrionales bacterium]|nr:hypothetical protein [Chitinivibrionales bacterium]